MTKVCKEEVCGLADYGLDKIKPVWGQAVSERCLSQRVNCMQQGSVLHDIMECRCQAGGLGERQLHNYQEGGLSS